MTGGVNGKIEFEDIGVHTKEVKEDLFTLMVNNSGERTLMGTGLKVCVVIMHI